MTHASKRSKRDADATAPVRTTFLAHGDESPVHAHTESGAWMHVLSGEVVEERWTRDEDGSFLHEQRALRGGQSMAAPGGVLHRVRAVGETVFVTTCACGCLQADAADAAEIHEAERRSRSGVHHVWATQTVPGEPSPD
jgi:quercetin dioxygenase-like cupin family protein